MSLGYYDHLRTRYLRTHEEIFDYRKAVAAEKAAMEEQRRQVCDKKYGSFPSKNIHQLLFLLD